MGRFSALGTTVLGVSADTVEAQRAFARKLGLTFGLLADAGGRASARYGALHPILPLPGRRTVLIDASGVVREIMTSFNLETHGADVSKRIAELQAADIAGATT